MYPSHPFPLFRHSCGLLLLVTALLFCTTPDLSAQESLPLGEWFTGSMNIVLPQQRSYRTGSDRAAPEELHVVSVHAEVEILDDVASTRLTTEVAPSAALGPGESTTYRLLLPIPHDAEIIEAPKTGIEEDSSGVILNLGDEESIAAFLAGARALAASEVLEFAGQRLVIAGPFTLESGRRERVVVTWRQNLQRNGKRIDYILPRSESFAYESTPWSITTRIESSEPIAALYSPSHPISSDQSSPRQAVVTVDGKGTEVEGGERIDPGDFRLSLLQGSEVEASFMAYAGEQANEGCLLMLIGANPGEGEQREQVKREVILVIDRSGSMGGEKIEQARQAARNVLDGLDDGEAFTIVDYADSVDLYRSNPVLRSAATLRSGREYIAGIESGGGTNIHDALLRALAMEPTPGYLPIVIFLTDGMPTTGVTAEDSIRRAVVNANVHNRRIFTVGVGYDMNAPLLDAIARESRASTTIVMPGDEVDRAVDLLFRKLDGPVFSDITLRVTTFDGRDASDRITDLLPTRLHDLYEGDYLSLLGHYRPDGVPVRFIVTGTYMGVERTFTFTFDPERDQIADAPFICRLWASREIMERVDEITRDGAIPESERSEEDRRRLQQNTEDIIDLSMANGIITEYTRHLTEGSREYREYRALTDSVSSGVVAAEWVADEASSDKAGALIYAESKLKVRAQDTRSGASASNQVMNKSSKVLKGGTVNKSNTYIDADMNVVEIHTVQQLADLSFFRRGDRWVDARILDSAATESPAETITFGSDRYDRLVRELVRANRAEILGLRDDILMRDPTGRIVLIRGSGGLDME